MKTQNQATKQVVDAARQVLELGFNTDNIVFLAAVDDGVVLTEAPKGDIEPLEISGLFGSGPQEPTWDVGLLLNLVAAGIAASAAKGESERRAFLRDVAEVCQRYAGGEPVAIQ